MGSIKEVFFPSQMNFSNVNIGNLLKDVWIGFLLSLGLGYSAPLIAAWGKNAVGGHAGNLFDAMVVAILIGLLIRMIIGTSKTYFKVLPGILMAQVFFIPIGIIFYGKSLNFKLLTEINPLVLLGLVGTMILTFAIIYFVGRKFGLGENLGSLLGFGSAVCGASAIAMTSPFVDAEPDDTATALVLNTILTVITTFFMLTFVLKWLAPELYAQAVGFFVQQTGFCKVGLSPLEAPLVKAGMALKSMRVALLVLYIPCVTFILRRKIVLPWFLLVFVAFGLYWTYSDIGKNKAISELAGQIGTISLATVLASVGMNANFLGVFKKLWVPLAVSLIAFAVGFGIFMTII